MLTNNQFKYISYGIMIFIVLILICNIYITKINNNYTASGLIEGFGRSTSQKDTTKLVGVLPEKISAICNNDNKDKIISYAKSFGNDIPKLKGVYVMSMMTDIEAMYTGSDKRNFTDIMKDITTYKNLIDALDTIGDNIKYLEKDCGGGLLSGFGGSGSSSGVSFGGDKKGSSWFGSGGKGKKGDKEGSTWFGGGGKGKKEDKKSKDKPLFGWATNNSSDSD